MKDLLLFVAFFTLVVGSSKSQVSFPTNREVYNFAVGDTFIFQDYHYNFFCQSPTFPCFHDYCVVVKAKHFSANNDTVFYTYFTGGYSSHLPFPAPTFYTNLDSAVILSPYPGDSVNAIDTAYIDSTSWCTALLLATSHNRYTLSDFYNQTYVSGLGETNNSFHADEGSSQYNDFFTKLVYFNKGGIACGSYNPLDLVSTINPIVASVAPKLYPNPVEDLLHIDNLRQNLQYLIYDEAGKICQSGVCQGEIPVGQLLSGMYFIRVQYESNCYFKRFMKQ